MSGCTTAEPADALPDVAATASAPTVTPASPNVVVTDIETCEAFTDVSTILHNAAAIGRTTSAMSALL
jgi:hypothetical protein